MALRYLVDQEINKKPDPSTYQLSQDNLSSIICYLKKEENNSDLEGLISHLEVGLKNGNYLKTSVSKKTSYNYSNNYEIRTNHCSLALKVGSSKWEGGEHDDDEVEVPFPNLKEIEKQEQKKMERHREMEMRRELDRLRLEEEARDREKSRKAREAQAKLHEKIEKMGVFGVFVAGAALMTGNLQLGVPDYDYRYNLGVAVMSTFESGEHDDEEVTVLRSTRSSNNILTLPNGIQLTYGEIIAFAGDFYGIPESPICVGTSGTSYESRFMDAFNTLARGDFATVQGELQKIRKILKIEKNSVATVLGRGDPSIPTVLEKDKSYNQPSDVYKYHGLWFTIQYDTILGGHWVNGVPVWFGRMMKLAENNPDHFQPYSRQVWETGQRLALEKAEEASIIFRAIREEGEKMLHEAYAISAFSCHFLTDSFAAGHIRVPRVELPAVVTPKKIGNYLVHFQHDEDGKFGLNVINEEEHRWKCFGDGTLYDEKSKENKKLVREVVQDCVNQVWQMFRGGPTKGDSDIDTVLRKIPRVDTTRPNNFPLFRAVSEDGKLKVLRRSNVNDLSDSTTIDNWWGWSTVMLLRGYDPKNSVV